MEVGLCITRHAAMPASRARPSLAGTAAVERAAGRMAVAGHAAAAACKERRGLAYLAQLVCHGEEIARVDHELGTALEVGRNAARLQCARCLTQRLRCRVHPPAFQMQGR